jgi:pyruvate dehydrogenase E2 component (dihydrolipoamide acetyltransferase)
MIKDILLPELGENISGGEIVRLRVAPGDRLAAGDAVVEIETDKAVIEVPAGIAGVVTEVLVAEGVRATVGQLLLRLEAEEGAAAADSRRESGARGSARVAARAPACCESGKACRKPEAKPPAAAAPNPAAASPPADPARPAALPAPAAPSVRREARELGVDIHSVPGSGPNGRISVEDVRRFVKERNRQLPGDGGAMAPWRAAATCRITPACRTRPASAASSARPCRTCAAPPRATWPPPGTPFRR